MNKETIIKDNMNKLVETIICKLIIIEIDLVVFLIVLDYEENMRKTNKRIKLITGKNSGNLAILLIKEVGKIHSHTIN